MKFWKENVDRIIEFNDKEILKGHGSISHKQMEKRVKTIYDEFDSRRKKQDAIDADKQDLEELKQLENQLKRR